MKFWEVLLSKCRKIVADAHSPKILAAGNLPAVGLLFAACPTAFFEHSRLFFSRRRGEKTAASDFDIVRLAGFFGGCFGDVGAA